RPDLRGPGRVPRSRQRGGQEAHSPGRSPGGRNPRPLPPDGMSDGFATAAEAGIHRLAIPTPFAVGRVNVYLIEDDPLTLVDTGPNSGSSLDELERQIASHGHRIEDLGMILITHQHIDHIGLVSILAARSGAEVAAIDHLVPLVEGYREAAGEDDAWATETMTRNGIPS